MEKSLGLYILRNILTCYPLPNGRPFDVLFMSASLAVKTEYNEN